MNIQTRIGLLGFLLVLSALNLPSAQATTPQTTPEKISSSLEARRQRLAMAFREREAQLPNLENQESNWMIARGFADGSRGGWTQFARGGVVTGPGGGDFVNAHPAYGGAVGWRDGGGFANGVYGGSSFANGPYGGAGFVNGAYGGAGFRNW